jgi:hypothetical protein
VYTLQDEGTHGCTCDEEDSGHVDTVNKVGGKWNRGRDWGVSSSIYPLDDYVFPVSVPAFRNKRHHHHHLIPRTMLTPLVVSS